MLHTVLQSQPLSYRDAICCRRVNPRSDPPWGPKAPGKPRPVRRIRVMLFGSWGECSMIALPQAADGVPSVIVFQQSTPVIRLLSMTEVRRSSRLSSIVGNWRPRQRRSGTQDVGNTISQRPALIRTRRVSRVRTRHVDESSHQQRSANDSDILTGGDHCWQRTLWARYSVGW